jgi:hypothetical protein
MSTRAEQWQRLVDLMDEADAIQQNLLGDKHTARSNELFELLNNLADEFTDFANTEGVDIV